MSLFGPPSCLIQHPEDAPLQVFRVIGADLCTYTVLYCREHVVASMEWCPSCLADHVDCAVVLYQLEVPLEVSSTRASSSSTPRQLAHSVSLLLHCMQQCPLFLSWLLIVHVAGQSCLTDSIWECL